MDLGNYVQVNDRLLMALEKHPDLRIRELDAELVEMPDGHVLICRIEVGRDAQDEWPVIASASEPYPGRTPYTRGSERMVGMTSALGRALGYMGFGISASIASANEVAARQGSGDAPKTPYKPREASGGLQVRTTSTAPASDAQKRLLRSLKYAGDPAGLTKAEASAEIERLKTAQVAEAFDVEEPF
jgi:hypothetical protein